MKWIIHVQDYEHGSQRVPDHGGHLHPPGSGDDAGYRGGLGGRIPEGGYGGPEEPLAEDAATA